MSRYQVTLALIDSLQRKYGVGPYRRMREEREAAEARQQAEVNECRRLLEIWARLACCRTACAHSLCEQTRKALGWPTPQADCCIACGKPVAAHFRGGRKIECRQVR